MILYCSRLPLVLSSMQGRMDSCILMAKSTKWGSCAVEALLQAAGAIMTDHEGRRYCKIFILTPLNTIMQFGLFWNQ